MIPIPNPLHPAVVHFPIVLILIGTVIALIAIFIKRWHIPLLAAGLLFSGAAGAVVATWSGDEEEEVVGEISAQAEEILDAHEEWGETTRNVAIAAAILAISAVAVSRFAIPARILSMLAAIIAIWASFCVVQTGHYGGQLVYKHGVGINTTATSISSQTNPTKENQHRDDD